MQAFGNSSLVKTHTPNFQILDARGGTRFHSEPFNMRMLGESMRTKLAYLNGKFNSVLNKRHLPEENGLLFLETMGLLKEVAKLNEHCSFDFYPDEKAGKIIVIAPGFRADIRSGLFHVSGEKYENQLCSDVHINNMSSSQIFLPASDVLQVVALNILNYNPKLNEKLDYISRNLPERANQMNRLTEASKVHAGQHAWAIPVSGLEEFKGTDYLAHAETLLKDLTILRDPRIGFAFTRTENELTITFGQFTAKIHRVGKDWSSKGDFAGELRTGENHAYVYSGNALLTIANNMLHPPTKEQIASSMRFCVEMQC